MNIKFLLFLIFGSLIYILTVSSSNGRASAAGEGNTGAPGDNSKVCSTCHNGGSFNPTVDIRLIDENGNVIEKYLPNTSYKVEVQIDATSGTPNGYGFQLVSLKDADDSDVSQWSNPASNTKIASAMGRSYAEHAGVSATNVFSLDWLSPAEGSGSVSFYAGGNAIDGDGKTSGDSATKESIQIEEDAVSSDDPTALKKAIGFFPNPVKDICYFTNNENEAISVSLFNLNGARVFQEIKEPKIKKSKNLIFI